MAVDAEAWVADKVAEVATVAVHPWNMYLRYPNVHVRIRIVCSLHCKFDTGRIVPMKCWERSIRPDAHPEHKCQDETGYNFRKLLRRGSVEYMSSHIGANHMYSRIQN